MRRKRSSFDGEDGIVLHIEVSDKVVALDSGGLGRFAVAVAAVCEHGFADVNAAVVHEVDRDDRVADACEQGAERHADGVVADVSEVLRLVGVRRGVFDENAAAFRVRQFALFEERGHVGNRAEATSS